MKKELFASVIGLVLFITACSGGGPQFPFDTGYSDEALDYEEGRLEAEQYPDFDKGAWEEDNLPEWEKRDYDPACEPPPFEEEHWIQPAYCRDGSSKSTFVEDSSKCPNGCTTHKAGCDIKGNISYNTKEKICHIPGQNFYSDTKISPEYGERWFCTEGEAKDNGWRKAKN